MMQKFLTHIWVVCFLFLLGFTIKPQDTDESYHITLLTIQNQFEVGKLIQLQFKGNARNLHLIVSTALATVILEPGATDNGQIKFSIPSPLNKLSGVVNWVLVKKSERITDGFFTITTNPKATTKIESYLGPQRIAAGGNDFAQLTLLPTDQFDNPLPDNTVVTLTTAFETIEKQEDLEVKNFISWKNTYSTKKSGRIFTAANSNSITSKLQTIYVDANLATPFKITYSRSNKYADSDQITTFISSDIKDIYGNSIPDATQVNFIVKTNNGEVLQTSGNTINGSAKASLLHPSKPQIWEITAFVTGITQSNTLRVEYEPALKEIKTNWDSKNNVLNVGPLRGRLNQILAEGTLVKIHILKPDGSTQTISKKTESGSVNFEFKKDFYKTGIYNFKLEVLGVTHTLEGVEL
ncbi:hypothetical protein [Leeuwenhoekiella sp. NPDC079379]|uniref:hypothetical protein n=1 Tax=Leeuwenhoekiella sp. NPDC079379 TaxID=3364122 RepID=UPI0037C5125B